MEENDVEVPKTFRSWISGQHPQGIGSLLQAIGGIMLGVAALVALFQTNDVLTKVLEIQQQTKQVEVAISTLEKAVSSLELYIKKITAKEILQATEETPGEVLTREKLEEILKIVPLSSDSQKDFQVYLPQAKRNEVIEGILNSKNKEERALILEQALKIDN